MSTRLLPTLTTAILLHALLWFGGCSKAHPPQAHDDHAGHEHGDAHDSHEGHDHAAAETGPGEGAAMCGEHGVPEAQCAICQPDKAAELKPGESLQVRLPSKDSSALVGIESAPATQGPLAEALPCMAELRFNQNKLAQIAAPVGGIIQSVEVDLGGKVREKQTVAKIWSADIAEAVAKAVLTHQTLDRERKLRADRITSEQSLQEAEANHRAACQQARMFGFDEEQIDALGKNPDEAIYVALKAPFAGEIIERSAVRGAMAEAGQPLFAVADLSVMWAMLQIPESALGRVAVGQRVELEVDALPGKVFAGELAWISPAVDERTRMGLARAEIPNPEGLLKDKMFAAARIRTREEKAATHVPQSAIQYLGGRPFVFVRMAEDLFDARAVRLGAQQDGRAEILEGLRAGEEVAVARAFAVKSAMLMSRLGAGCAHD